MSQTLLGYICCLISCAGFGTSYLPVKKADVRDGWFFTLVFTFTICLCGIVQWLIAGMYKFEPFAMIGGAVWATGNVFVPFIIKRCGLGVGQLVWSVTNMLTGWACGNFGLLGVSKSSVAHPLLNYFGVLLAIMTLGLFALMKEEQSKEYKDGHSSDPEDPCQEDMNTILRHGDNASAAQVPVGTVRARPPAAGAFLTGFFVALAAGMLFGSNFNAPTWLQNQGKADKAAGLPPRHSTEATDYIVSHFCGIFATTSIYFSLYQLLAPKRSYIGKDVLIPGLVGGLLWAVAQIAWFKANDTLSFVISFPIIVGVPGIFAVLWGVCLFGENSGARNRSLLAAAIVVQAVAVCLIALSKGSCLSSPPPLGEEPPPTEKRGSSSLPRPPGKRGGQTALKVFFTSNAVR